MTQTTELARVKARIKALAEKTVSNGCTEAEALAAAEMVGRLLERYALSMEEVDVRAAVCVQAEVPIGGARRRPVDAAVPAIARFCDCKVWLARGEAGARYVFFGFETDTALARYLFAVVDRAIRTELAVFRVHSLRLAGLALRRASASFQHGMAIRVAERLEAMHRARNAAVAAQRPAGTALMVVKQQVVQEAFRAERVRLVAMRQRQPVRINAAFRQGVEAGDRVNLNRPFGSDSRGLIG